MFYFGGEFLSHGEKKILANGFMDLTQKIWKNHHNDMTWMVSNHLVDQWSWPCAAHIDQPPSLDANNITCNEFSLSLYSPIVSIDESLGARFVGNINMTL
jgi:hypothetical protein